MHCTHMQTETCAMAANNVDGMDAPVSSQAPYLTVYTANDASCDAVLQVQGAAQGQHPLPCPQALGGAKLDNRQRLTAADL